MERAEIEELVKEQTAFQMDCEPATLTAETRFRTDLGMDSLDYVELVMELEDAFAISIPDKDAEKIETIGQAVDYLEKRMAAGS